MGPCDGEMGSCDDGMASCDDDWGECEECLSDDAMPECPYGDDSCSIMDDCDGIDNDGVGHQSSGGQHGGAQPGDGIAPGGNLPGNGPPDDGDPGQHSLPVVNLTREQAEAVRTSGYYITGISRNRSGLVDRISFVTYRGVTAAGGRRLGQNPFSTGAGDDVLQVQLQPNDPKDKRIQNGWRKIDPTWVSDDPTVRAAQRSVLYRDVRDLQSKIAAAERECQRNQEGYYSTNDKAAKNKFAVGYQKAHANLDALQADLQQRQLQLALTQESGAGGP
jgi:hypothetical protein